MCFLVTQEVKLLIYPQCPAKQRLMAAIRAKLILKAPNRERGDIRAESKHIKHEGLCPTASQEERRKKQGCQAFFFLGGGACVMVPVKHWASRLAQAGEVENWES